MKKKGLILLLIFAIVILGIVFYKSVFVSVNNIESQQSIRIGVALPLTGGAAFVGKPLKEGIDLRIKQFNDSNGKMKIYLTYEDTKASPKIGKNVFLNLFNDNINFVIGPASSGVASNILKDINENKMTTLSPTASKSTLTQKDYFFRNELSDAYGAKKQADYAIDKFGWEKISVIYVNNEYGVGVLNDFEEEYIKKQGVIVNKFAFNSEETNFKTIINKIINDDSMVIFIIAENEYVNIIKQLYENNNNKQIYATPVFENEENIKQLGNVAEGIIYTYYGEFNKSKNNKKQEYFKSSFINEYNKQPNYYASLGYESSDIFIEAFKSNIFKTVNINDKILTIRNFRSVTGNLSFNKFGDVIKPVSLKTVKNSKFIFLD